MAFLAAATEEHAAALRLGKRTGRSMVKFFRRSGAAWTGAEVGDLSIGDSENGGDPYAEQAWPSEAKTTLNGTLAAMPVGQRPSWRSHVF
ncbi:MAG: hypothetical protein KA354_20875 [Phycisphaerae bacterium]|nr:hypothetical protein [Phycisphaerae bacterium]